MLLENVVACKAEEGKEGLQQQPQQQQQQRFLESDCMCRALSPCLCVSLKSGKRNSKVSAGNARGRRRRPPGASCCKKTAAAAAAPPRAAAAAAPAAAATASPAATAAVATAAPAPEPAAAAATAAAAAAASLRGTVVEVKTAAEVEELKAAAAAANCPLVLSFGAPWCRPCSRIKPLFQELAAAHAALFAAVDVEAVEGLQQLPQALPTFQVFRNKELADQLTGALPAELKAMVSRHCKLR
ncbi:hypothetical protein ETH_00016395 [Eimeria tenella]|uniref:Thioredoxin domain-containing protein n=1 Tax=Eimeria tenella TaxID=5802 RepID=U6KMW9_EIMTE|nr:hypothetical protein ETH_00016395 [Eimeria tenella]CDJ37632.1 hypothetical protein ETH_00016395 [Eimeria tenella]|eukprot:XP_013228470.1 hypothetical protein ETH_00016395 [Eimeria tenella]